MTADFLNLKRERPFIMNQVHFFLNSKQLCDYALHAPEIYERTSVLNLDDCCGVCCRALREHMGWDWRATEEDLLRVVRADYDEHSPNKFWQHYGVTYWS